MSDDSPYDNNDPEGMRGFENDAALSAAPSPAPSLWSQMSDLQRIGLIGATLKDVGAHLDGRPQDAGHLDAFHALLSMPNPANPRAPSFQVAPVPLAPAVAPRAVGNPGALAMRALGQLNIFG